MNINGTYIKYAKDSILTLLQVVDGKTILVLGSNRRKLMILQELSSDFYGFTIDKSASTVKYNSNVLVLSSNRDVHAYLGMKFDYIYSQSSLDIDVDRWAKVFVYDYWR